ncbi:MAG: hypothetical protein ACRC6A_03345 [Fusobacteriaceae bacterium]
MNEDKELMRVIRKQMDKEVNLFKKIYDIRYTKWGTFDSIFTLKDEYLENKINHTFHYKEINLVFWNFVYSLDDFQSFYSAYTFLNQGRQDFLAGDKNRLDYDKKLDEFKKLYLKTLDNYNVVLEISQKILKLLRVG